METIEWKQFMQGIANLNKDSIVNHKEVTNIKCPKCGALLFKITDKVFTSYPPKYQYVCDNCNWNGFA